MIDLKNYEKAFSNLPNEINEAEVNAEKIVRTTLRIKDGMLAGSESSERTKLYVRASGERTGMVYSEKLDEAPEDVLNRALENSKYSLAQKREIMGKKADIYLEKGTENSSIEDAVAFGVDAEKFALQNEGVERVTECVVALCGRELKTINSNGLDTFYKSYWVESSIGLMLKREEGVAPGYDYTSGDNIGEISAKSLVQNAIDGGHAYDGGGLKPCNVKSGKYAAVLSGRVMRNIIMTAWRTLSGSAMLSGETIFSNTPGTKIGSEALSIINAPTHDMLGQAWLIDSEGIACAKTKLVQNGKLVTPLYTLESGKRAGMPSTGSAGRMDRMTGSLPIKITTVPAILYAEPGDFSQEKLIERMGTGFLLTYSLDLFHSVNVASGEFSIPCGGVYYNKGKPIGSVSQMSAAGNIKDLFGSIEAMGNDLDFDDFYLKSYTIGSPSALVSSLNFSS